MAPFFASGRCGAGSGSAGVFLQPRHARFLSSLRFPFANGMELSRLRGDAGAACAAARECAAGMEGQRSVCGPARRSGALRFSVCGAAAKVLRWPPRDALSLGAIGRFDSVRGVAESAGIRMAFAVTTFSHCPGNTVFFGSGTSAESFAPGSFGFCRRVRSCSILFHESDPSTDHHDV